jgi:hypothetical protein
VKKTFQIFNIKYYKIYFNKNPRKKMHMGKADNKNIKKTICQFKQSSVDI